MEQYAGDDKPDNAVATAVSNDHTSHSGATAVSNDHTSHSGNDERRVKRKRQYSSQTPSQERKNVDSENVLPPKYLLPSQERKNVDSENVLPSKYLLPSEERKNVDSENVLPPKYLLPSQERKNVDSENVLPPQYLLPPMLPSQQGKYTLVIDMDGTILAEVENRPESGVGFAVEQISTGKRTFISKRPGLEKFLHQAAQLFEIVVFTESCKRRADVLLNMLENRECISHRLYRDSCREIEGKLTKDLSRLGRDVRKVIIMDDCPFAYVLHRHNAIPVRWYNGNPTDGELQKLLDRLKNVVATHKIPIVSTTITTPPLQLLPLLPPCVGPLRHTLVLDMDKTLLLERHQKLPVNEGSEYFETVETFPNTGKQRKLYIYKRPGLECFLKEMAEIFEIVVFTLSIKSRADYFLDQIDPQNFIKFRLYRDSSCNVEGKYVKDLYHLGRDLRRVIIIDDTPISYEFQQTNAIPIIPFQGLNTDAELKALTPLLRKLAQEEDVRLLLYEKFDLDIRPVHNI